MSRTRAGEPGLSEERIEKQARRLRRARRQRGADIWFGLGMFGLVGWAVAIPTVIGLAIGIIVDARTSGSFSWTLALLLAGVGLGCLNAWYWLTRQRSEIERYRVDPGQKEV